MKHQLQKGHWYLVHLGDERVRILPYMDGGWYPRDPWPKGVFCEMGTTDHPDNVSIPNEVEVSDLDRAIIEAHYPAAATHPEIAHGIFGLAMGICLANGKEWDYEKPDADPNDRVNYLIIACGLVKTEIGEHGVVRTWAEVVDSQGAPLAIFKARKWPTTIIPGAQLLNDTEPLNTTS